MDLLHLLRDNGIAAFVVGGAVRDMCQERPPEDVDILAHASIDVLKTLFKGRPVRVVGNTFPVCLVNDIEVVPCRAASGRFPEDDLAMRDFTVNAMAYDPLDNRLEDPHGGRGDLERRVIRFTGDPSARIKEDPVRMIRGCRFGALLSARLSEAAQKAIHDHASLLAPEVPGERIRNELLKAMALQRPSDFFRCLHDTGLLAGILPSLDRCYALDGGPFHGETFLSTACWWGILCRPVSLCFGWPDICMMSVKWMPKESKKGGSRFTAMRPAWKPWSPIWTGCGFPCRKKRISWLWSAAICGLWLKKHGPNRSGAFWPCWRRTGSLFRISCGCALPIKRQSGQISLYPGRYPAPG